MLVSQLWEPLALQGSGANWLVATVGPLALQGAKPPAVSWLGQPAGAPRPTLPLLVCAHLDLGAMTVLLRLRLQRFALQMTAIPI